MVHRSVVGVLVGYKNGKDNYEFGLELVVLEPLPYPLQGCFQNPLLREESQRGSCVLRTFGNTQATHG